MVDGSFVDEDLQGSQSDLLYQVEHAATGQPVSMYLLFEHQSSPDPWMRLRLLRYCCRIWEADRRDDPDRRELRPIVPVVFYQGARGWSHSTEFSDLFPEAARALPGYRGSLTSSWTRRLSIPTRLPAASGVASPSC